MSCRYRRSPAEGILGGQQGVCSVAGVPCGVPALGGKARQRHSVSGELAMPCFVLVETAAFIIANVAIAAPCLAFLLVVGKTRQRHIVRGESTLTCNRLCTLWSMLTMVACLLPSTWLSCTWWPNQATPHWHRSVAMPCLPVECAAFVSANIDIAGPSCGPPATWWQIQAMPHCHR